MVYLNIDKVSPGFILGKDIITEDDRILLRQGAVLTERLLTILKSKEISHVYIDNELTSDIEIEEVIPQTLKNNAIRALQTLNIQSVIQNAGNIVEKILESSNLDVNIYDGTSKALNVFEHSFVVSELSIALGKHCGYNQEKLSDLAVSALLHDVGKLTSEVNNTEAYNVEKMFKKLGINVPVDKFEGQMHPIYGFNLLDHNILVKATIKQGVLAHHENVDGTGPLGMTGDRTHEFAKIIHIADTFVNLISNPEKENLNSTSEVIEFIIANAGYKFDRELAIIFANNVPLYPPGLIVQLSNGMRAIVAATNKGHPTRPKVLLEGRREIVDLLDSRFLSFTIMGVYNEPKKERGLSM